MKKKFAKSLLIGSVAIAFASPTFAQEMSLSDLTVKSSDEQGAVVTKVAEKSTDESVVKAPEVNSKSVAKKSSEVNRLDELTTLVSQGNLELAILQQEVQRKEMEKTLKEDDFQIRLDAAMKSISGQFFEKEQKYLSEISSLKSELRQQRLLSEHALRAAESESAELQKTENSVYVTNIVGVGSNLSATIYFEDKIFEIREGMPLSKDISVSEILSHGVIFNHNGNESFVALTNEEYAFSQTFNKKSMEMMEQSSGSSTRASLKR
jgi:TolA-binding protein